MEHSRHAVAEAGRPDSGLPAFDARRALQDVPCNVSAASFERPSHHAMDGSGQNRSLVIRGVREYAPQAVHLVGVQIDNTLSHANHFPHRRFLRIFTRVHQKIAL